MDARLLSQPVMHRTNSTANAELYGHDNSPLASSGLDVHRPNAHRLGTTPVLLPEVQGPFRPVRVLLHRISNMMLQRQDGHAVIPSVQQPRRRRRHGKRNSVTGSSHEDLPSLDAPSSSTGNLVEDACTLEAGFLQSKQQANDIIGLPSDQTSQSMQGLNQSPFHAPLGYSSATAGSSPPQPDSPTGLSSALSGNSSSYAGYFHNRLINPDHCDTLGEKLLQQAALQTADTLEAGTDIAQTGTQQGTLQDCHQLTAFPILADSTTNADVTTHIHTKRTRRYGQQQARRVLRVLSRLLVAVKGQLRPKGIGHNDRTASERVLNVVSCLPFVFVGRTVLRTCSSSASRHFGRMFLVVAGVAAGYHGATGNTMRQIMRLADYWTIAAASGALRSAVYPSICTAASNAAPNGLKILSRVLCVASCAVIPFAPSVVSSANFAIVEARCLWLACKSPSQLMRKWASHTAISVVAVSCFFMEDAVASEEGVFPGWHAAWHVLSAAGILTTAPFLAHLEDLQQSPLLGTSA